MNRQKSIVYLGYSRFPVGFAEVQKMILISKSLMTAGNKVTVICRNGTHDRHKSPGLKVQGAFENIRYVYASGSVFRNDNFFRRRWFEAKGRLNEIFLLRRLRRQNELDFVILSTRSFSSILFYSFLSKIFRFRTILNYVEYYSALKKGRFQLGSRLNDKLFDRYAPFLSDAVFPISEFLVAHIKKVSPRTRYLKIPVLTDFDKYKNLATLAGQKYFLFCGDATYKEVVLFIIDAFGLVSNHDSPDLYLIVGGNEANQEEIKNYASHSKQNARIKFFTRLSEKDLYTFYSNATALLIPLRPTFQDTARFPHKTGEYLASGNPVISTNYGEIKFYFKDGDNMLIAEQYDTKMFAEKMQFVLNNPGDAKNIGTRGKNLACRLFDYRSFSETLNGFLNAAF